MSCSSDSLLNDIYSHVNGSFYYKVPVSRSNDIKSTQFEDVNLPFLVRGRALTKCLMVFDGSSSVVDLSLEVIDNEWWFDLSDRRRLQLHDRERRWFKEKTTIPSQIPICYGEIRTVGNSNTFSGLLKIQDVKLKSFAPFETLQNEFESALVADTETQEKNDPETLDDSDLELLAGDEQFPEEEFTTLGGSPPAIICTTFVASRNMLKTTFRNKVIQCPFEIIDCKIKRSVLESPEDVAIILSTEGIIYSAAFDAEFQPFVMQWWKLQKIDGVPRGISVLSSSSQFVVTTDTTLKFYRFTDAYHFELVSNLNFADRSISQTSFLNNGDRGNHFMIFSALRRRNEITLCLTQWGAADEERKEVHTLTLLESEPILSIIALDDSRCLTVTDTEIKLVTANQVLSGELIFNSFKRSMFGSNLVKCFDDLMLLSKLKSIKEDFQDSVHCTVFSTSNGALCCCLSDEDGSLKFLALTRIKGLDSAFLIDNSYTSSDTYVVVISSFGQLIRICLDLNDVQELEKDYKINSFQNVRNKQNVSAGHGMAESIAYIPGPQRHADKEDRLCLLSQAAISVLSPNRLVQDCSVLLSLKSFRATSTLKVLDCRNLSDKWKNQLMGSAAVDTPKFLVLDETPNGDSSLLLVEWTMDYSAYTLTELDDVLRVELSSTVMIYFTEHNFVQVTSRVLSIDSFEDNNYRSHQVSFIVTGAMCEGKKLLLWNAESGHMLFIDDIDDRGMDTHHEFKVPMECKHSQITAMMFMKDKNGLEHIIAISDESLHQISCDDLISSRNGFCQIGKVRAHYGDSLLANSYLSDLEGCLYRISMKETTQDNITIEKLDVGLEFGFPWRIRLVNVDECILFSPRAMYLLNLADMTVVEVPVGVNKKHATIIDVRASEKVFFVLFSDGLEVLSRSCLTHTRSHLTVRNARTKHKQYLSLDRINRMLIVNWYKKTLESAKLENGRLMTLDSRCLEEFETITEAIELKREAGPINLIIAGTIDSSKWIIKFVQVVPCPGKLITREVSTYNFEGPAPDNLHIVPVSENAFWLSYGTKLQLFLLESNVLNPVGSEETTQEELTSLDANSDIVVSLRCNGDIKFKTREKDGSWSSAEIVKKSPDIKYRKPLVINRDCIAIVGDCNSESSHCAVITFFTPFDGDIIYFNEIWFAEPIRDVKYSNKNDELCVLHTNGSVVLFSGQQECHRICHVVGHKVSIDYYQDATSQTGCWDFTPHRLLPSQQPW
ncbi:LAME_0F04170g1_1 [Lachancea meyersii CBS 8951]|uniref:LAME_0F04170g1_1 n=1 Tax=Lachancea meyersii CBS 8951 TaxID=1266667 RepID=A0A1G4JS78_9SACH|nr:LAME_0F04170g1_1 [Lachancea meyersii CBS 8951]